MQVGLSGDECPLKSRGGGYRERQTKQAERCDHYEEQIGTRGERQRGEHQYEHPAGRGTRGSEGEQRR